MTKISQSHAAGLTESDFQDQADFRYAIRRFSRYSELRARREGITPQQHLLLLMVRGHAAYPRVSIGDVAERMQIKHHSASLLVERTVQRGLIIRTSDETDRRRALVALTDDGQAVLDRITIANRHELGELEDKLFRTSFIETLKNHADRA